MNASSTFSHAISSVISAAYLEFRPPPVKVKVLRVPADKTRPHCLELETTHEGVECGPDSFLNHVPYFKKFWGADSWHKLDICRFRLNNRSGTVNGVYYCFWSYFQSLPRNAFQARLRALRGIDRGAWGDIFMVKMAEPDLGKRGWAKYEHISEDLMKVPVFVEVLANIGCRC